MNLKKHKAVMIILSVIALIGISVSAVALSSPKAPDVSSGNFKNLYADRLEINIENTDFEIIKSSEEAETVTVSSIITIKKTQADFYGILNSLSFSGIAYDSILFTALNSNTEDKTPFNMILGVSDNEPDTYKWQMDVTFSVKGEGVYPAVLTLDYTTGYTKETSQQKILEIPFSITVK